MESQSVAKKPVSMLTIFHKQAGHIIRDRSTFSRMICSYSIYTIIKAVVAVLLYDDKSYFCQAVRVSSGAAIIIKKGDKHDPKKNYDFTSQLMASHYKVIFSRLDV